MLFCLNLFCDCAAVDDCIVDEGLIYDLRTDLRRQVLLIGFNKPKINSLSLFRGSLPLKDHVAY